MKLTRRRLLAASGGLFTLPLLEGLFPARALAQGSSDPRRLVMIHLPNGTVTRQSAPTWFSADGVLTAANAPIPLQPFTANLQDVTILKNLTQSARNKSLDNGAGGHGGSKPCFFTGQVPGDRNSSSSTISGDSFDVMYGKLTPQGKSVYLANAQQGNGDGVEYPYELSHKDGERVIPEINPVSFYNTWFRNLVAQPTPTVPDAQRNPKILQVSQGAASRMRAMLGKNDRVRLDAYLSGLSDLRASFAPVMTAGTCTPGASPTVSGNTTDENLTGQSYFDRMFAFNQMIAVGFACDLWRSVAISFGAEGNYTTYDGVYPATLNYNGASLSIQYDHSVSHQSPISGEAGGYGFDPNMTRDRVHLYVVLDLVNRLKAVTDPSGSTVLDNTMVMAGFCVDDGQHDSGSSLGTPVVVCGGKNFITPGRAFDASHYDLNDLYFTFGHFLSMGLTSFNPMPQTDHPYGSQTGRNIGSNLVPL